MYSPRYQHKRPLGYCVPESRLELQVEKALFRTNAEILRNLCIRNMKEKQKQMHRLPIETSTAAMTPEVRWLLTRSAKLQRVNDASFAMYSNQIKDRVVSAGGRRGSATTSLQRQRSMCYRTRAAAEETSIRKVSCDVLGPSFCTDCTEITKKNIVLAEQKRNFPRIEVHSRALVAPQIVERLYLSHPKELFFQDQAYKCGCPVDPCLEIATPLVYSRHEIFERIRKKKSIQLSNDSNPERQQNKHILAELQSDTDIHPELQLTNDLRPEEHVTVRPEKNTTEMPRIDTRDSRPSFHNEKTEPPMNMKVSITFRNDGHC